MKKLSEYHREMLARNEQHKAEQERRSIQTKVYHHELRIKLEKSDILYQDDVRTLVRVVEGYDVLHGMTKKALDNLEFVNFGTGVSSSKTLTDAMFYFLLGCKLFLSNPKSVVHPS